MSWNLTSLADVPTVPWRNGGGLTRELLAWPDAARWTLRLSVAAIERDGPFSRFEGVQRRFAVLSGAGVRLRVDGATHVLTPESEPLHFDGAAEVDCALLDGPTLDFNLMVRGGHAARLERVRGEHRAGVRAGRFVAAWAGEGGGTVALDGDACKLPPMTLAWRIAASDGVARLSGAGALWMEVDL